MSTIEQSAQIDRTVEEVMASCRRVAQQIGWGVIDSTTSTIHLKKPMPPLGGASTEVRVELGSAKGGTSVLVRGSLFGFGPVVQKVLKADVGMFTNGLIIDSASVPPDRAGPESAPAVTPEALERLERLGGLVEKGLLTREEFENLKKGLLGG